MRPEEHALTNREFWQKYWEKFIPYPVPQNVFLSDLFDRLPQGKRSFIEIGGFPGVYSAYFKKYKGYDVTLVDHFIIPEVLKKMEALNSLPAGSIRAIEADFSSGTLNAHFDVVFSVGFIEHFTDTGDVVQRHVDLLNEGGYLLVSLPNFRGLNGWVQRALDPSNYSAHNLDAMVLEKLHRAASNAGLRDVSIDYYGKPVLWLEHSANVSKATRAAVRFLSKVASRFSIKGRLLSPFIVLTGHK